MEAQTELAAANPEALPAVRPSVHAVAVSHAEMKEANEEITVYLNAKLEALRGERSEIREAINIAVNNGWKTDAFDKVVARLSRQVTYYDKLVAALDAGYTIVPNMPCDQFAIRVKRAKPIESARDTQIGWQARALIADEKEQILEAGDGRYESPNQLVREERTSTEVEPGKKRYTHFVEAVDFDSIEFPFAAAVPVVMTATQAAMALKLFDRIGLVPQQVKRVEDPIVLGQIVMRENGRERVASFLIAWHLDMRTL